MKPFSLISVLFAGALNAAAAPSSETVRSALAAQASCQNFVRFDDQNLYLGFGPYRRGFEEPRQPIPSWVIVASLQHPDQKYNLATLDSAIDAVTEGNDLFVLTYSGIEEWDLSNRSRRAVHPTFANGGVMAYQEHARAFARYGNKIVLAHGALGVSFFDLKTRRLTNQYPLLRSQLPLESMATGVTVQGKYAYVVMDNVTLVSRGKPAFRGFVVIDMETEQVVRELVGLDPGVTSIAGDEKDLVVSFGGWPVWHFEMSALQNATAGTAPTPRWRVDEFEMKGHPIGAGVLLGEYYHTCYWKDGAQPGQSGRAVPVSLPRRAVVAAPRG